jgi:hypothetical protein
VKDFPCKEQEKSWLREGSFLAPESGELDYPHQLLQKAFELMFLCAFCYLLPSLESFLQLPPTPPYAFPPLCSLLTIPSQPYVLDRISHTALFIIDQLLYLG